MRTSRWDGVALLSIIASLGVTAALYTRLPDPLPTHFDLHGTPNGWMPRAIGAWGIPAFAFVLWAFVRFVPRVHVGLGLVMPRVRRNPILGIRTACLLFSAVIPAAYSLVIARRAS